MSRIGKNPIPIPDGVTININHGEVTAKGPGGVLKYKVHPDIEIVIQENEMSCHVKQDSKKAAALWGTSRARLNNIVLGVHSGFAKELEFQGVGYKAKVTGKNLELAMGYSHPVIIEAPEGITFSVDQSIIKVMGIDKELVGQIAANIRAVRKPEPYKGKGIRYLGERVRRKVGKVVGAVE